MQKKIIALAVAGLASTAAFAQSNVTIYGSVDMGYSYRYDSTTAHPAAGKGLSSQSAINGGQAQGNRLGFKGVEDLGNGVQVDRIVKSVRVGMHDEAPFDAQHVMHAHACIEWGIRRRVLAVRRIEKTRLWPEHVEVRVPRAFG